ncbi:MAG: metalloregulator ArsR/SmtB family transcription factor [Gammaproteobacteria bacterium]|nr:metalloregulator ArsR/SmtB family transcription factor [Gammaproteobacteria bacterium]
MNTLDHTFSALSDSTRRAIIARLVQGESSLSELAKPFDMSQTAVSKHVRVLSEAGLVNVTKRGRTRYCQLMPKPIKEAADWLHVYETFWENNLQALGRYLEEDT